MAKLSRNQARLKKAIRIRKKFHSKTIKFRLFVHKSLQNFEAQLFDETKNQVVIGISTVKNKTYSGNIKAAKFLGKKMALKLKALNVKKIIFDRSGYIYHGRVKAFAEVLRSEGVKF